MKSVEYVNRFGEKVCQGDQKVIYDMFVLLATEVNGQAQHRHIHTEADFLKLIGEFNRKGNVIAELFERKYGKPILNRNWFRECVAEIRKGSGEKP